MDTSPEKELLLGLLQNTHESLKWMWQIIMGAALVIAVQTSYIDVLNVLQSLTSNNTVITDRNIIVIMLLIFAYLPMYFRIFYGDNRFIDLSYMEAVLLKRKDLEENVNFSQFTGLSRFFDLWSLIFHAILFIYLSTMLNQPFIFIYVATFYLAFNSLWLIFIVFRNGVSIRLPDMSNYTERMYSAVQGNINEKPRNDALMFWIFNNVVHFFLLVIVISTFRHYGLGNDDLLIYICIGLFLSNSVIDLIFTWEFYFPNLDKFVKLSSNKRAE